MSFSSSTPGDRTEFGLIQRILDRVGRPADPTLGIGDDCAAFQLDRRAVITTDTLLEGVHFNSSETQPERIGHKSIAVNLSDIAAMAARPRFALLTLGLPEKYSDQETEQLVEGVVTICEEYGVELIGGDTNRSLTGLMISVTMIGEAEQGGIATRSGALPDDWLFVTGKLGGSIHGRHLDVVPRIHEALMISAMVEIHAMIDISDGLGADLRHICDASQCGAMVDLSSLPIHSDTHKHQDDLPTWIHAMSDGEDFELLFSVSEEDGRKLQSASPVETLLTCVGRITKERAISVQLDDGNTAPWAGTGYDHFR